MGEGLVAGGVKGGRMIGISFRARSEVSNENTDIPSIREHCQKWLEHN